MSLVSPFFCVHDAQRWFLAQRWLMQASTTRKIRRRLRICTSSKWRWLADPAVRTLARVSTFLLQSMSETVLLRCMSETLPSPRSVSEISFLCGDFALAHPAQPGFSFFILLFSVLTFLPRFCSLFFYPFRTHLLPPSVFTIHMLHVLKCGCTLRGAFFSPPLSVSCCFCSSVLFLFFECFFRCVVLCCRVTPGSICAPEEAEKVRANGYH